MNTDATNTIIGVILCQLCVLCLAFGSNIQRLGLESKSQQKRVCFLPPNVVWAIGLATYFVGNFLYMAALWYAPASLMAALFAAMLPVNTLVARMVLKEPLTRTKIIGCLIVLVGIAICGTWGPYVSIQYSVDDMAVLTSDTWGAIYLATLFGAIVTLTLLVWVRILRVEKRGRANGLPREQWLIRNRGSFSIPMTLAMFESTATLCMKGGGSILINMLGGDWGEPTKWLFWAIAFVWIGAIVNQMYWLRQMLKRFEASMVIPIEYGTVTIVAIIGGLVYYQERKYCTNFGILMMIAGMGIIALGLAVIASPELQNWSRGGHELPTTTITTTMTAADKSKSPFDQDLAI